MALKLLLLAIGLLLLAGLLLELVLRFGLGFGNPPLYVADPAIGYRLAPNQRVRRLGNRIYINQYSMRSDPITLERPPTTLRVLLLGDSIVNGGWWTDQADTLSALVAQALQATPSSFSQIEVLNASANSWGPRNQLAYLEKFGVFQAQVVVLVINTDDLFATAPTSVPVGRDRTYPAQRPVLALVEAGDRYLKKPTPIPEMAQVLAEPGDRVGFNLTAVGQMQKIVQAHNGHFLLAMTPLKREVAPAQPRDYEAVARQRLMAFTQQQTIPYLDFLPIFNDHPANSELYRDHIHLSPQGNQLVSTHLQQFIREKMGL